MSDLENKQIYKVEESFILEKKGFNWKLLATMTSIISFLLLFGIWYANNERAFLAIENNRLKAEVENLNQEIKILQTNAAHNDNSIKDTNSEEGNKQTSTETGTETTTETSTDTGGDSSSYIVKPGDTLAGISTALYGSENHASEIAAFNNLNTESILQVGQTLKIPNNPSAQN